MSDRNSEPATTHWDDDDDPSQDTLVLLQEEIARLEAELRARDESPPDPAGADAGGGGRGAPDGSDERVAGLLADLAGRDETVEILLEQSRLYEEAAAAQRAEWEQLNQWVEEVERRLDGRDADGPRLRAELEAERDRAEALRRAGESDRRGWEAQRSGLEREAQILRDQLAGHRRGADDREGAALVELAAENRRLRVACETLGESAAEAEGLGRRLAAALADLDQARHDLRHAEDERRREQMEHEAEAVALRSRLASEALLGQPEPQPAGAAAEPGRSEAMDPDERIRAFRQHLREVHEDEAARRAGRSISARLSRIWRHTGPG